MFGLNSKGGSANGIGILRFSNTKSAIVNTIALSALSIWAGFKLKEATCSCSDSTGITGQGTLPAYAAPDVSAQQATITTSPSLYSSTGL